MSGICVLSETSVTCNSVLLPLFQCHKTFHIIGTGYISQMTLYVMRKYLDIKYLSLYCSAKIKNRRLQ
jgi:hypothetical protein